MRLQTGIMHDHYKSLFNQILSKRDINFFHHQSQDSVLNIDDHFGSSLRDDSKLAQLIRALDC